MRSVKSGLLALAIAGFLGTAAVIGCSASGDSTTDDTSGTDPGTATPPNTLPPSNGSGTTDPPPAPGKDGGKKEAGVDAGPPPPNPGDPCTKADAFATKQCGKCGTQQAICQSKDGTDGGALAWSDYGPCGNEDTDPNACVPGTTGSCGNCGTFTCSKYCAAGSCSEPPGACKAGSIDYTSAGCTAPNTYKSRTCSNACSWSGYSVGCAAPNNPNKMQVPTSVNGTTSAPWSLTASTVGDRLGFGGTCPGTADTGNYPYVIVEVQNTTAQKATISLQTAGNPTDMDLMIWAYNKTLPPPDDTALQACDYPATDECPSGSGFTCPASGTYYGGLKGVTINAGASVLVMIASYYSIDDGFGTPTGTATLQIKTTGLM